MGGSKKTGLIFGKSGAIGSSIYDRAISEGINVWACSSSMKSDPKNKVVSLEDLLFGSPPELGLPEKLDFICFAQGVNLNDSIFNFEPDKFDQTLEANCKCILLALKRLISLDLLAAKTSICILSSIWQNLSRNNKLSYSISKAALRGLVLSLVADLAPLGHRVNAVLPGPIDNEMTRANLSPSQLAFFESGSPYGRLASTDEVVSAVLWLLSEKSAGITGNFIKVHNGFGDVITV